MRIKQSLCYPIFQPKGLSLDAYFAEVAKMGFAAIELWGRDETFPEVVRTAKKHGLVVGSMIGHMSLESGMNDRRQHERIARELKISIDLAAEHGIAGLICFSGNRQPGLSEQESIAATVDCCRQNAPYAEQKGVNLNLELLNSKVDHPGYECDRSAWGLQVVKQVNSPCVKLLYDIYHMQIMEGDVIRTIRENIQWIGHFHTAGNPGRKDMDDEQELNYAGICRAIAATGYDLYVGHEFFPKGDPVAALRHAFAVCDQG